MLHYFGFFLFPTSTVTLLFDIVATATADWANSGTTAELSEGLWQCCVAYNCFAFNDVPQYVEAVRAMMIIGGLMLLFASAIALYISTRKYNISSPTIDRTIIGLLSVASVTLMIGMIVFTTEHSTPYLTHYGYSYVLGWLAVCLSVILCSVAIVGSFK